MLSRLTLLTVSALAILTAQDLSTRAVNLLHQQCAQCHSGAVAMSGLRLDTREALVKGGTRGAAIKPGEASASLLMNAVRHAGKLTMPPGKKMSDADIALLAKWVDDGAAWPTAVSAEPAAKGKTWWSFQPPKRPQVPTIAGAEIRTPIDAFVIAKLQQAKLQPAKEASKRVLIRRAFLDLHGLPPTAERVDQFLQDTSADAYEKLVDELLASPRYGEKWGRHWLDLVRYGDTSGFEQDPYLLYAWRYRDYVIESFNQDKPYDRFVKEQIAGDELFPDDPVAQSGTGYFTVGPESRHALQGRRHQSDRDAYRLRRYD